MQYMFIQTWQDCAAGKTDVVFATSVNQVAMHAISRAEQELCDSNIPEGASENCYEALARKLAFGESTSKGGWSL